MLREGGRFTCLFDGIVPAGLAVFNNFRTIRKIFECFNLKGQVGQERPDLLHFMPVPRTKNQYHALLRQLGEAPHQLFLDVDQILDAAPPQGQEIIQIVFGEWGLLGRALHFHRRVCGVKR